MAVGCSVTLKWTTRRRWWARMTRTKRTRRRAMGTVRKSIETRSRTWLARNVRQVFEGELAAASDEEREEPEQVESWGDHERRLWLDEAGESITYWADDVLANDSRSRTLLEPGMPGTSPLILLSSRGWALRAI